ncbi:hypothetical protein AGMMS50249_3260 [candidate division SR1 bacterium]|nr:hypothetical protein AGMMS50249_3260 [candidate division SR1 bacterium]
MGYVYVLELSDGMYYIGSTKNIENRIQTHQNGDSHYTRRKLPCKLLAYKEHKTYTEARIQEIFLKKSKSRKITEQFISENRKIG